MAELWVSFLLLESEEEETKEETGGSTLSLVVQPTVGKEAKLTLTQEVMTNGASTSASGKEDSHSVVVAVQQQQQANTATTISSASALIPNDNDTITNGIDLNGKQPGQTTSIE